MFRALKLGFWIVLCATASHAADLLGSIKSGSIEVVSVNGNGSSSGAALNGILRNTTGADLELDTILPNQVYFDNEANGQNMVATQVYLGDMTYLTDGSRSFITISAGQSVSVVFVAYCADFDLDNPEQSHNFIVAPMPYDLDVIARRISKYEMSSAGSDLTKAAQVALWIASGESLETIREKFDFTDGDLAIAYEMLR